MKTYYCNVEALLDEKLFRQGMRYADRDRRIKIEQLKHPLDKARSLGCFLLYRYLWIHDIAAGKGTGHNEAALYEELTIREGIMTDNEEAVRRGFMTDNEEAVQREFMTGNEDNIPHINIGKNGKPDIDDIYNVHISFSHSGSISAAAYHVGRFPIGMDIQLMSSKKVKDHVAEYIMSETEFNDYRSDRCRDKCAFFYQVLCCKEAFTKMTGDGIDAPFGKLDIGEIKKKYLLHSSVIELDGKKYMLAVCGVQKMPKDVLLC